MVATGDASIPVPNARVWLSTTRGLMVDTTRSDSQGRFTLSAEEPGRYVITLRRLGYFPEESDPVRLDRGQVLHDTVYVESARVLQPVDVVVCRQASNRFGVDTMCYQLRARGCAPVYVDGMLSGTDAWISATDIESIVVISDTEAFIRFRSNNRIIAVFTNLWTGR